MSSEIDRRPEVVEAEVIPECGWQVVTASPGWREILTCQLAPGHWGPHSRSVRREMRDPLTGDPQTAEVSIRWWPEGVPRSAWERWRSGR